MKGKTLKMINVRETLLLLKTKARKKDEASSRRDPGRTNGQHVTAYSCRCTLLLDF